MEIKNTSKKNLAGLTSTSIFAFFLHFTKFSVKILLYLEIFLISDTGWLTAKYQLLPPQHQPTNIKNDYIIVLYLYYRLSILQEHYSKCFINY